MEIVCEDIKYICSEKNKIILDNVNLTIRENCISSIIGENGSGKSFLLQILGGIISPSSGIIKVDNIDIKSNDDLKSKIGFISTFSKKQVSEITVHDEISIYLEKFNYKLDSKEKRIRDSLKMVGLDSSFLNRKLSCLSSGELKLTIIASILSYNPKVLIFDEPTLGLDYKSRCNLIKILRILKNRFHKTIIIASNDMDFVHKLSDNIFVLSKGHIVKSGNKYEIFTDDELTNKYHLEVPNVIKFSKIVSVKKNKRIGYRDEINDLLKDIYRYGLW